MSLSDQWRQLVLSPLSKLETDLCQSYILVVDALDECNNEDDIRIILYLLAEAGSLETDRLRIFLTSRPEIIIQRRFQQMLEAKHQDFVLHDISLPLVDHDIAVFLKESFRQIGEEFGLEAGWPGDEVIEDLVRSASGLFIWAATACRFIRKGRRFASYRLSMILKDNPVDNSATDSSIDDSSTDSSAVEDSTIAPEEQLNRIYTTVLENSVRNYTKQERRKWYKQLRQTIGAIILLYFPLSAFSLASLLNVQGEAIIQTLHDLHSILDIPNDRFRPLRLHHPSFRDFLLDKDRCGKHFYVDERQAHQALADNCIQLMSTSLTEDICRVTLPGTLVTDVEHSRIEQYVPLEVKYACLYWIEHLQKSNTQLCDNDQVHQFLQAHLLHWLEALGWIGKTSEGILAILSLEAQIQADKNPNLYAFVHDAKRFTLHNRSVIEQAPLQLYCSALVFAPERSIVRRQFEQNIPAWIQRKPTVESNWKAALQTLEGHSEPVSSVAFSPNSKQVVSGSWDKTVRLWDAVTGAALQTLEGHSGPVYSVAFSPNSKQVMSRSDDRSVLLWDAMTGAALQTLKGHSNRVISVAFSPDNKQVASGSYDETVRLWDAVTGAALQTLKGHSGSVISVAFSPNGKQVMSGSDDRSVLLWDAMTGAALQTLKGHSGPVSSVAFSPDGKQIVSGSWDETVRLWDAVTGAALQTLKGHSERVNSLAFSPNSKQIVSGSWDTTVRLWDAVTGAALQMLEGHSGPVNSVAFSPDGKQVVFGSWDRTVQLWDAVTGAALQTLEGHSGPVSSVAFSPNGKQVVSGSWDKTVRLWDAVTGAALQTLKGHSRSVYSVAFSPDGKQVVSKSELGIVQLWNTVSGAALQTLEGHSGLINSVTFDDKVSPALFIENNWIVKVGINILWLPPNYRHTCWAVWNKFIVIGHSSGRISILGFKEELRLI